MDTVPICIGAQPVFRGARIEHADPDTGLGGDDRAGCAVLLHTAIELLKHNRPHPPLTLLWTVQEEIGLHGARTVRLGLLRRPKLAFNWDGGAANKLTIGATGGFRMQISVRGLASHAGGHPEQGVSAISIASLAVASLVDNGWHGLVKKGRRAGTSNVGVIHGGTATNIVADHVDLWAEARSHDAKFRARIVREMERAFKSASRRVKNIDGVVGRVTFDGRTDYESFLLDRDNPSVQAAADARAGEGLEVELAIANRGLDANWLSARGIPTLTLGCGQREIHTVDEWLDVEDYLRACRIAQRIATADKQ
jgi:tripeptide aminopeptidase